jgi:SAM-dependent methyltransferase
MTNGVYLQYGCGWDAPDGWLNFDASPSLRVERIPFIGKSLSALLKGNSAPFPDNVQYGDIIRGLPVEAQSCDGVYCSHILEHLSLEDFRIALDSTNKLLKSGGIFRFVLPDLAFYIREYQASDSPTAALDFMRSSGIGEPHRNRGLRGLAKEILGNSRHRWMWDYPSMEAELKSAGFTHIRRAEFGDSVDPRFREAERRERWENGLGGECKKI